MGRILKTGTDTKMAVSRKLVDRLGDTVRDCHLAFKQERSGKPADYIPALAEVDPELFAVSVCTVDGECFSAGDCEQLFSIQSVSKPFLYAQALSRLGENRVMEKVGVEPTGYSFNSIVRLEGGSNRADNPMVNAGAIAISGLLAGERTGKSDEKVDMNSIFLPYLNREKVEIDNEIFSSEVATGNRNYSIANLLKYHQILDVPVEEALDLYFRACSTMIDTRDLAIMAATLANYGVNPVLKGGKRALLEKHNAKVLAVMSTCGLYDYSGEFVFFTGLPAKSGVSGCVMAVVPGVMGIALYSPRIDSKGNSIRALCALPYLSEKLNLHVFHPQTNRDQPTVKKGGTMPSQGELEDILSKVKGLDSQYQDNYLKEADGQDPNYISACIYSVDGEEVSAGDADKVFSIQAGINPIVFGYGLEARGLGKVMEKVGVEPSGNLFNAILFQPDTNIPYNPLSNAGAIAVDSILPGASTSQRFEPLLALVRNICADQTIEVDQAVLALERSHADRNKAIAYMLRHFNVIQDIERPLGLYYRQCSIAMNCRQVARMAAVLANGGRGPIDDQQFLKPVTVQRMLSVMYTCGLYDYSGRFAYDVGIPAKSGLSGIIYGVLPGKFGVAVYAPGVDIHGNSLRGLEFFKLLARLSKYSVYDRLLT